MVVALLSPELAAPSRYPSITHQWSSLASTFPLLLHIPVVFVLLLADQILLRDIADDVVVATEGRLPLRCESGRCFQDPGKLSTCLAEVASKVRLIKCVRGGCGLQVYGAKVSRVEVQFALIVLVVIGAYNY